MTVDIEVWQLAAQDECRRLGVPYDDNNPAGVLQDLIETAVASEIGPLTLLKPKVQAMYPESTFPDTRSLVAVIAFTMGEFAGMRSLVKNLNAENAQLTHRLQGLDK